MQYCSHCHRTFSSQTQFCPEDGSRLQTRTEFDVGMVVRDKYQILEILGEGGMGRVYKVKDLYFKYGRNLGAMKVPSAGLAANPSYLERFIDEAAKARALDHPNIVRIENVDKTDNGVPFLVMELVEGLPLRTWLERQTRFDWRQAAAIVREIALALAAAHKVGIIHCDIKPENILAVNRDAPVPLKVADFGLAKATEALRSRLTRVRSTTWAASSTPGTLDYMSPEQTVSRDRVTEASDVYSLGIIFYELLTGKTPFAHLAEDDEVRRAHREQQPASLRGLAGVPQALIRLVESMLEKDPDWRPTAVDVASGLDRFLGFQATEAEPIADIRKESVVETAAAAFSPVAPSSIPLQDKSQAKMTQDESSPASGSGRITMRDGEIFTPPAPVGQTSHVPEAPAGEPHPFHSNDDARVSPRISPRSTFYLRLGIVFALLTVLIIFYIQPTFSSTLNIYEEGIVVVMYGSIAALVSFSLAHWRLHIGWWASTILCVAVFLLIPFGPRYDEQVAICGFIGTMIPLAILSLIVFQGRRRLSGQRGR